MPPPRRAAVLMASQHIEVDVSRGVKADEAVRPVREELQRMEEEVRGSATTDGQGWRRRYCPRVTTARATPCVMSSDGSIVDLPLVARLGVQRRRAEEKDRKYWSQADEVLRQMEARRQAPVIVQDGVSVREVARVLDRVLDKQHLEVGAAAL